MFTFVVLFTLGRSGTAYLSQVFGHEIWERKNKSKLHVVEDKYVISHESGWGFRIPEIKANGIYEEKSKKIQVDFYNKAYEKVKSICPKAQVCFISDMLTGRYYSSCFNEIPYRLKVIFLSRNIKPVIKSFMNHGIGLIKKLKEDAAWTNIFYSPLDKSVINKVHIDSFQKKSRIYKLAWYYKEFHSQWKVLKSKMDPSMYMEINYEDIVGPQAEKGLDRIKEFTGIPYSKELIPVRVNKRNLK
jgi:hypothetical protein